jgi:hypothetical protein
VGAQLAAFRICSSSDDKIGCELYCAGKTALLEEIIVCIIAIFIEI